MNRKRVLTSSLLGAVLIALMPALGGAAPASSRLAQEGSTNLLKNPGFEGLTCAPTSEPGWCEDNWSNSANADGSFHDNIFTPQGWMTWWRTGGEYGQPEVKTIPNVDPFIGPPARINSGKYAVQLFTFYRNQDAGFFQVVSGLEPGATVQFSAYAHGYSCNESGDPYTCGDAWNQVFQVGIEPNGFADAFSPGVVWSAEQRAPDTYQVIGPITAQVGDSGSVTVILRSKTKWRYKHQDAYWDDTSLVVTSPGSTATPTAPPPPPTATPGPPPTPRPTATPRPDGATVHVVEAGDTLLGIALAYDVEVDQIERLNAGSIGSGGLIVTGQELVVSLPSQQPEATPLPEPPANESNSEAGEEVPVVEDSPATAAGASICVLAYHDRNADTYLDEEAEELLPNAEFAVSDASGVVDRYVSDGLNEPFCFTGLASGAYHVTQMPPAGYVVSGAAERDVAIVEGTSIQIEIGSRRADAAEAPVGAPVSEDAGGAPVNPEEGATGDSSSDGKSGGASIFSIIAKVSGVLVLVLAAGIAVLFFLTRRQRA